MTNSKRDNTNSVAVAEKPKQMGCAEIAEVVNSAVEGQFLEVCYRRDGLNFSSRVKSCSRNEILLDNGNIVRLTPNGWECSAGGDTPSKVTGIRVKGQDRKEAMK